MNCNLLLVLLLPVSDFDFNADFKADLGLFIFLMNLPLFLSGFFESKLLTLSLGGDVVLLRLIGVSLIELDLSSSTEFEIGVSFVFLTKL